MTCFARRASWPPGWSVATIATFRSFTRSDGRGAGIERVHHDLQKLLRSLTTTRLTLPKRLSVFAMHPVPPPSPVLVLRRTTSFARVIRQQ